MKWKLALGIVAVGAAASAFLIGGRSLDAANLWKRISGTPTASATPKAEPAPADAEPDVPDGPWDGIVSLDGAATKALDIEVVPVRAQVDPVRLEVNGTTAYDPGSLTQVRTRFAGLVTRVCVRLGDVVHKGDPLVDIDSTDLAEAKSLFEERTAQHAHDKQQFDRLSKLHDAKAVSDKVFFDAMNDESQSRLELKRARDKLEIYGLTTDQIDHVPTEDGTEMARMTLKSPVDGLVIDRQVVPSNLYEMSTVLMTIAPQGELWVKGHVYESDMTRVHVGQTWEIQFPFDPDNVLQAKIEQVDARVDPETKTVKIRTTIPNVQGRLKSDMLVRGAVLIPPDPGRTVVPRVAVVVSDADAYVFVRIPGKERSFLRRKVVVQQEGHSEIILSSGLQPGEEVVARGSLMLAQIDEDLRLTHPADGE